MFDLFLIATTNAFQNNSKASIGPAGRVQHNHQAKAKCWEDYYAKAIGYDYKLAY